MAGGCLERVEDTGLLELVGEVPRWLSLSCGHSGAPTNRTHHRRLSVHVSIHQGL